MQALKLPALVQSGLMRNILGQKPQNPQPVYSALKKTGRRGFPEITNGYRNFANSRPAGHGLSDDFLIEHESVGIHAEVYCFEHRAVKRAITSVVFGVMQAKAHILEPREEAIGIVF